MNKLVAMGHRHFLIDQNLVKINWRLTDQCNYRCPYCFMVILPGYAVDRRDQFNNITNDKLTTLIRNMNTLYKDNVIDLTFTGGEPTLTYDFINVFFRALTEIHNLKYVRLHTNLALPISFWREFSERYVTFANKIKHISKIDVECSMHLDYVNTTSTIDEYINKAHVLESVGINVNNTVMINSRLHDIAYKTYNIVKDKLKNKTRLRLTVDLITGKSDLKLNETEDEKNPMLFYLYEDGSIKFKTQNEIVSNNINRWTGLLCNVGKTMLNIAPDGLGLGAEYIDRCTDNPCYINLYNCEVDEGFKPIICKHKYCIHPGDFQILKLNAIKYKQWINSGVFIENKNE